MPRYDEDEPIDYDEMDRNAASSERISNMQAFHDHELMNDVEDEIEQCDECGRFECICSDEILEETEETRYLDKRLSDREDFHSDESVGPIDFEPYYPDA